MDLETASEISTIAQQIVAIVGIGAAGIWAYYRFVKGRKYAPRLTIGVSGTTIARAGSTFLVITVKVQNVGTSRIDLAQKGSGLELSGLSKLEDVEEAESVPARQLATWDILESHKWVEPLETIEEQRLIQLEEIPFVALQLWLRVVTNGTAVETTQIVEMLGEP
ncbi:MAG: hypothetical protein QGI13_00535 [Rhodospirillales bacterium]|jgi:hypothetical protein|nr:hypothetical protein [Rhodospirillales bacterium]